MRHYLRTAGAMLLVCAPFAVRATVQTEVRTVTQDGTGGRVFDFTFPYLSDADIVVTQILIADASETTLVLNTDYTLTRVGTTGGRVTTAEAVSSAYQIRIERTVDLTQEVDLRSQGRYLPDSLEAALDHLIMALQQVSDVAQSEETQTAIENHIGSSDDHSMYAMLFGRVGGQTLHGGTGPGDTLHLVSTLHGTKGQVLFDTDTLVVDDSTDSVGIGINPPVYAFDVFGNINISGNLLVEGALYGGDDGSDSLSLSSTTDATKGKIIVDTTTLVVDEVNNRVGIGTATPSSKLHVVGDSILTGTVSGSAAAGYTWYLEPTSHATEGVMVLADVVYVDDADNAVGIGDEADPSYKLKVAGDQVVSGALVVDGDVYGGTASGEDLYLRSTTDLAKGFIDLDAFVRADVTNGEFSIDTGGTFAGAKTALNVMTNYSATAAAFIWNDGNNVNRYGLEIQAGLDTPAVTGDITWMILSDGNGDPQSVLAYHSVSGAYLTTPSDRRLKRDIRDTRLGLATINAIPVREYTWKDSGVNVRAGIVAQEALPAYPEMVSTDRETGMYMINDAALIPVMVRAIQELSAQVEALEQELGEVAQLCDGELP